MTSSAYPAGASDFLRTDSPTREPVQEGSSQVATLLLCKQVRPGITRGHRRSPLTCPSPAQTLCLLRPTPPNTSLLPASLPLFFILHLVSCFKIMVAVCFTWMTDSSGSGWLCLAPPPWTPILTAPPSHLVTAEPSACCAVSSAHIITFSLLRTFVPLFFFINFHNSFSKSERLKPFFL